MRLFVPLAPEEFEQLSKLAQAERRRCQDQAAVLIAQALTRHGKSPGVDTAAMHADAERDCLAEVQR